MSKGKNISYLYDKNTGIELIYCSNSAISYPLHNHTSVFTFGLILQGSISLTIAGKSSIYGEDGLFAIPPYIPHSIESQNTYTLLTFCINKNALVRCNITELTQNMLRLLDSIRGLELTAIHASLLIDLLNLLNYGLPSYPDDPVINIVKEQIECNPEAKINIDEMARSLYISKFHFIRKFKQNVGLTPHQFQIQNRVRKAQHMLNDIGSTAEAALIAGFCDQSHFIKQFKKFVGLTPAEYKASYKLLE